MFKFRSSIFALLLTSSYAYSSFHLWQVNEVFSNGDGTIQFVELSTTSNSQEFLVGKSEVTLFDDLPLLKVNYNISSTGHKIIKYFFDKILALILTITVLPFISMYSVISTRRGDFTKFILNVHSVLFGNNSFVGPREKSFIDELFIGKVGLTGIWFTEAANMNNADDVKRINLYYAKNQNIWLDLEILGKTVSKMFLKRSNND